MGETTVIKELIPYIDKTYRTIASRTGRAIQGMSMGGFGAMRLALKYPEPVHLHRGFRRRLPLAGRNEERAAELQGDVQQRCGDLPRESS